ncbi:MAG: carbamate kinase [Desulfobacteraceae bacterium]|nr:carbamate kinase [Desulfobacteraceae bacterium]
MKNLDKKETILLALGGNALIKSGQEGTAEQQFENLRVPLRHIAKLSRKYNIIITHGNGPQVGNLLLQQECCNEVPKLPLEILVAQTQGQIGYMIESTLDSELMKLGINAKPLVTLISYVVVDEDDPAFKDPSKPIGPVYTEEEAAKVPYPTRKTAKGYRRVVVSPRPVTIVEKREIKKLIKAGFVVICCGGGGIPVVREGRAFSGVDAVIDKDLVSAKLAEEVKADIFIIASDVPGVAVNFGKPDKRMLDSMTLDEAAQYMEQGHFPPGSMGPKVEAAMEFIKACGKKRAVIASIDNIEKAVKKEAGTHIIYL